MGHTPYNRYEAAQIPIPVLKSSLSKGAKLLYGVLVKFGGVNGKCFPARETLAWYCSTTERNIRRLISELVRTKYIRLKKTKQRTYYIFNIPESWADYEFPWMDSNVQAADNTVQPADNSVPGNGQYCPARGVINVRKKSDPHLELIQELGEGNQERASVPPR